MEEQRLGARRVVGVIASVWTGKAGRCAMAVRCLLGFAIALLCSPAAAAAAPMFSTVTFTGDATNPQVTIFGSGFGIEPATTNPAYQGSTGYDYGNALYLCDTSSNPNAFCAGQNNGKGNGSDTIGLVVSSYADSQIVYTLGSDYASYYYPSDVFRLQQGDQFTMHVNGATCSGMVDYSGSTVSCSAPPGQCTSGRAVDVARRVPAEAPGALRFARDGASAATYRPRRSTHRRALDRVFANGQNEIAVAPGKPLSSAYYHFEIPASRPFPQTAPQIHLDPIEVDSSSRRLFLRFTSTGCPDVVLTGTFRRTPLKVSAKRRSFRLKLSVPLSNFVTGARAGTLTFQGTGKIPAHFGVAADGRAAGSGGPGGVSLSLSGALDVYSNVLGAVGDNGKIASATATLPAVEKGGGGRSGNSTQPVGSSYKGSTTDNMSISIELSDDKSGIKKIDVTHPAFPCTNPYWQDGEGDESTKMTGPIKPNDAFGAWGEGTAKYTSGAFAGYQTLSVIGAFTPSKTVHGVTIQYIQGTYTLSAYVTIGPATGILCAHTASFSAGVVATSG